MSLIGDLTSGPILPLWLLDHAWLIQVCTSTTPTLRQQESWRAAHVRQGLATQGRRPH